MIELVMVFALGFLIAGLMALAFAPLFWARAVRLSVRRLEMQLPISMREILADRDQVRAEAAVVQRRIEMKAEALNKIHADDRAELGRRTARIAQVADELAGLQQANGEIALELAVLKRQHAELSAEAFGLSKELYDLASLREREAATVRAQADAHEELLAIVDDKQATIAALLACSAALDARLADSDRALNSTRTLLSSKEAEASLLATHLSRAQQDRQAHEAAHASALETQVRLNARVAELEQQLTANEAGQGQQLTRLKALAARAEIYESDLRSARERENALELSQASTLERMRAEERGLTGRIDRLRAENAALQTALESARSENAQVSHELLSLRLNSSRLAAPEEAGVSVKAHTA